MASFLETNVYSFRGTVLICGACLPEVSPEGFRQLSARADGCYALCLERDHLILKFHKNAFCPSILYNKFKQYRKAWEDPV